jgi:hypothetical protein
MLRDRRTADSEDASNRSDWKRAGHQPLENRATDGQTERVELTSAVETPSRIRLHISLTVDRRCSYFV